MKFSLEKKTHIYYILFLFLKFLSKSFEVVADLAFGCRGYDWSIALAQSGAHRVAIAVAVTQCVVFS